MVGKKTESHSLLLIDFIAFFEQSLVVCSTAGPVLATTGPEMTSTFFLLSGSRLVGETGKGINRSKSVADIPVQVRHRAGTEEEMNSLQECEGLTEEEQFDVDLE